MRLYFPIDLTGNLIMIEKLVLGEIWTGDLPIFNPDALTSAPSRHSKISVLAHTYTRRPGKMKQNASRFNPALNKNGINNGLLNVATKLPRRTSGIAMKWSCAAAG